MERGDSLWGISGSAYGDPTLWPSIFEANRETIADPDLIYPDQELVVPPLPPGTDATRSPGTDPTVPPATDTTRPPGTGATRPPGTEAPLPAGARRVVQGDSLWRIAGETLGDPRRWPEIYEANRDRIQDPDLIFPEQVFAIPSR